MKKREWQNRARYARDGLANISDHLCGPLGPASRRRSRSQPRHLRGPLSSPLNWVIYVNHVYHLSATKLVNPRFVARVRARRIVGEKSRIVIGGKKQSVARNRRPSLSEANAGETRIVETARARCLGRAWQTLRPFPRAFDLIFPITFETRSSPLQDFLLHQKSGNFPVEQSGKPPILFAGSAI